jgi:hypothetical protein
VLQHQRGLGFLNGASVCSAQAPARAAGRARAQKVKAQPHHRAAGRVLAQGPVDQVAVRVMRLTLGASLGASSQLMTAITLAQSQEEPSPYEHVLDHRQQVPSRASSRKPAIMFNARSNRAR